MIGQLLGMSTNPETAIVPVNSVNAQPSPLWVEIQNWLSHMPQGYRFLGSIPAVADEPRIERNLEGVFQLWMETPTGRYIYGQGETVIEAWQTLTCVLEHYKRSQVA